MKQQKLLKDWIARGGGIHIQYRLTDWIQDIQEMLLRSNDIYEDQGGSPDTSLITLIPKISYFEKLMVIRDLSREYTMSGKLVEGEM
jgi:hypothetical protein